MKKFLAIILCIIMLATPVCVAASGLSSPGELKIDPEHCYPGMDKSYALGYVPRVKDGSVKIVMPLVGTTYGNTVRVEPRIPREGPFAGGNYLFDVKEKSYSVSNTEGKTENVKAYLITLDLPLSENPGGVYEVGFSVSYTTSSRMQTEQQFSVTVLLDGEEQGASMSTPYLRIADAMITPDELSGDSELSMTAVLANTGGGDARNVRVEAVSEDGELILTSDLNGVFFENIPAGETAEADFAFRVSKRAADGEHIIKVAASFEGANGTEERCEASFRVTVDQPVELVFEPVELPGQLSSGSMLNQSVCVYNPSNAPAYNIHIKLDMEGVICATAFFDRLMPGDQVDKELNMVVTELKGRARYGETSGTYILTYEDKTGAEHRVTQSVKTSITASSSMTEEEKAAQELEQMKKNTLSKWWISALVAFAVIAILVSAIIIGKLSRLVKMK